MIEFLAFVVFLFVCLFYVLVSSSVPSSKDGRGERHKKRKKLTIVPDVTAFMSAKYLSWIPGFQTAPITSKTADWVFGFGASSRRAEAIIARLKSRMNSVEISDKVRLHEHAAQIAPNTIAKTAELTRDETGQVVPVKGQVLPPGPWMVRSNWGWKGMGNGVATNAEELEKWYTKLSVRPSDIVSRVTANPRVIASEYVLSPLTHMGLKFHARVYVVAIVSDHKRYAVMPNTIQLQLAGKPYVAADWNDTGIHDTHWDGNQTIIFMRDLPDERVRTTIFNNTVAVLRDLFGKDNAQKNMLQYLHQYPETKATCEIFGADFMYRSDLSAIIMEVNTKQGVDDVYDYIFDVRDDLLTTVIQTAGVDTFGRAPFSQQILNAPEPFVRL